jgi:hypothetical protein
MEISQPKDLPKPNPKKDKFQVIFPSERTKLIPIYSK